MIKSMTGFGKGEYNDGRRHITAEIKTVNHRYSDITVKMPRRYSFAEDKIKNAVKEIMHRGKADVSILVENLSDDDINISMNTAIAKQYYDNLRALASEFGLSDDISVQFLAGMPDVIKAVPDAADEEEIIRSLLIPVKEAAVNLDQMRKTEGAKLSEDLLMRNRKVRELTEKIAEKAPEVEKIYKEKLRERITELTDGAVDIPEDRILLEAAVFADKSNITEEIVRLKSHTLQFEKIISGSNVSEGKKLDFLVQEMNREANTIGSKANNIDITNIMLEVKAEVEKIREQVQNIE